jgi:hypothetical protein
MKYEKKDRNNFSKFNTALDLLNGVYVKSGILADNKTLSADGVPVVEYAIYNEFGTPPRGNNKGIPERPFVGTTHDEQGKRWIDTVDKNLENMLLSKQRTQRELDILGRRMMTDIKRKIDSITSPANSVATIKAKGSSKPLIDTGTMRKAVNYEVKAK